MKKFLFFLFFLIALGGAGFFFGWPHLTVPPGSYGVMRSKTHGLDEQVIREGEFRWYWRKLIPTNASVTVFTLPPVERRIRSSGSLSSGDVYAALAGLEADFSWEISGEFSFSIRPEALPELVERESLQNDGDLRRAEQRLADRIEHFALQRLREYADREDGQAMETLRLTGSLPELDEDIQRAFPEIRNLFCVIRVVRFPDYALYRSLKDLYREYVSLLNAALSPNIAAEAEARMNMNLRLDELARHGELLTRYPILLHFLALEKGLLLPDSPAALPAP
ncbi:MAG: hypothetical protein FWC65_04125 [Treponema sp.]|nr:hypothetical protein [Treponema sp.]